MSESNTNTTEVKTKRVYTKPILIDKIIIDRDLQMRERLNADKVAEYKNLYLETPSLLPAVVVFTDGSEIWLADGFHRLAAAKEASLKEIRSETNTGTRDDALTFALSANATHGMPRSNADKRRAVSAALSKWPKESSKKIAALCAVSSTLVDNIRSELPTVVSSEPETRVGKDGKERRLPKKKTEPKPEQQPSSEPTPEPKKRNQFDDDTATMAAGQLSQETSTYNSAEAIAAGDEAEKDNSWLKCLKNMWNKSTKKNRQLFLDWIKEKATND
jgi:hypothetical protein